MAHVEAHDLRVPQDFFRWAGCAAIVLAAHAALALALLQRPRDVDPDTGAPVVTIELSPLVAAPSAPVSELAPGPDQREVETPERPPEEARREPQPDIKPEPETPPVPDAAVTLPPPEPARPQEKREEPPEPKEAAPVPTAPPSVTAPAARPTTPAVGRVAQPTAQAIASWQRVLLAHLERHKRYPPQARGRQGIVRLAFAMDREGHVLSSRIAASSGFPILDDEALAMIRRAQPLPAPPGNIADEQLSFTLPIRYGANARR